MKKLMLGVMVGGVVFISSSGVASAAAPRADVQVQLQGPATVSISTPTTYTVTVKNAGPSTASNVGFTVALPLTNTSPTVHVLGTVSGLDSRCGIVANKISCALGNMKKGKTIAITYSYAAPVSTKVLQMTAVATSSTNDTITGNNTASFVPNLVYPARPITSATTTNSHCTGQNLSSYFECALYPSSVSSHETTLHGNGTISFTEPGYTGTWSQPTTSALFFEYFDGAGDKVVEFSGRAINGSSCFDGMATFFPASNYVSPYHVCF